MFDEAELVSKIAISLIALHKESKITRKKDDSKNTKV
jgi:hypothetical protein